VTFEVYIEGVSINQLRNAACAIRKAERTALIWLITYQFSKIFQPPLSSYLYKTFDDATSCPSEGVEFGVVNREGGRREGCEESLSDHQLHSD